MAKSIYRLEFKTYFNDGSTHAMGNFYSSLAKAQKALEVELMLYADSVTSETDPVTADEVSKIYFVNPSERGIRQGAKFTTRRILKETLL